VCCERRLRLEAHQHLLPQQHSCSPNPSAGPPPRACVPPLLLLPRQLPRAGLADLVAVALEGEGEVATVGAGTGVADNAVAAAVPAPVGSPLLLMGEAQGANSVLHLDLSCPQVCAQLLLAVVAAELPQLSVRSSSALSLAVLCCRGRF